MFFNDRRAKKAASATMKTTLGQMAKSGALRGTTKPGPGQKSFNKAERGAVKAEVGRIDRTYGAPDQPGITSSSRERWDAAARVVSKQKDVDGFEADRYRKN